MSRNQTFGSEPWVGYAVFDAFPRALKPLFWYGPFDYACRKDADALAAGVADLRAYYLERQADMLRTQGWHCCDTYGPEHPQAVARP